MTTPVPVAIRRNATKISGTASIPVKARGGLGFELAGFELGGCELGGSGATKCRAGPERPFFHPIYLGPDQYSRRNDRRIQRDQY